MNALTFIKQHEGCKLQSYQDQGGVWTIGYGCTGHDIGPGLTWTAEQAETEIASRVASATTVVHAHVGLALSEGQVAALASFVYNLGTDAFEKSTLLQKVKDKDFLGAAKEFVRWDHIGQTEVKGLLIRRLEEALLFLR